MAKTTNSANAEHLKNIEALGEQIKEIYGGASQSAAAYASLIGSIEKYGNVSLLRKYIDDLVAQMAQEMVVAVENGISRSWNLANAKNDELVDRVYSAVVEKEDSKYYNPNADALTAFLQRKTDGMNLSQRVWRYAEQYKTELEAGIEVGLSEGKSADQLSRDLRSYLQYPDKLFRRVRNSDGKLKLSQSAAAFHPGRGVYRSSYMNARRLAATEINMAYRTADYLRWQQLDFVVGQRIVMSNNHNCKGVPKGTYWDICDELSAPLGSTETSGQGCYPKDFKFVGWHPHCRCHAEAILSVDEKGIAKDNAKILRGKQVDSKSDSEVTEVPLDMAIWVRNNRDRIFAAKRRGKLPYFISDNRSKILELAEYEGPVTMQFLDSAIKNYKNTPRGAERNRGMIERTISKLLENNDFGLDINANLIESVFENGFLNTFQTGTSGGSLFSEKTTGAIETTHKRLYASHLMFFPQSVAKTNRITQYQGKQLARAQYEKYGHLLDKDKTQSFLHNKVLQYGNSQVRFKKDKVVATWTFGDSLRVADTKSYLQPSRTTSPHIASCGDWTKILEKTIPRADTNSLWKFQQECGTPYIELQYHGELTIDAVESIVTPLSPKLIWSSKFIKKLLDKGIELWYMDKEKAIQYKP